MTIMERLRRKVQGARRKPKVYAAFYGFILPIQLGLLILREVFSMLASFLPQLPSVSAQAIARFVQRINFRELGNNVSRMLDVGGWMRELGRPSSVSEVYRYLNHQLSELVRRKWAALKELWRQMDSVRKISDAVVNFLRRHTRNLRLLRRSIVATMLGVLFVKLLTVICFAVVGTITLFSFFGINCLVLLLAAINFTAAKIASPLARLLDRQIVRAMHSDIFTAFRRSRPRWRSHLPLLSWKNIWTAARRYKSR